ncbi:MAG: PaaI family thioesterase, partial [Dehalococcoidia bacterium]
MEYSIKLRKPTPPDQPVRMVARPVSSNGRVVEVEAELYGGGEITATCHGRFAAVKPGHPAYDRWLG